MNYPHAERHPYVYDLHGDVIQDPYIWLENSDSDESKEWIKAQNNLFSSFLDQNRGNANGKDKQYFTKCFEKMLDYTKFTAPFKYGDYYYYYEKKGLQNQFVLYRVKDLASAGKDGDVEVVLDPNTWTQDGTASLGTIKFSKDGRYLAYAVQQSGSDWSTVHVRDVVENRQLTDKQEWVKFSSIVWTHDNKGFYYCRYPKPEEFQHNEDREFKRGTETSELKFHSMYFHELGMPQDQDRLVIQDLDNPTHMFGGLMSDDGNYLVITVSESCAPQNKLYLVDLRKHFGSESQNRIKVADAFEAQFSYITNQGTCFYLETNLKAPRNKVIKVDISEPTISFVTIMEEHPIDVLSDVSCFGKDYLVTTYRHDVQDVLKVFDLKGNLVCDIELMDKGCVDALYSRTEQSFFTFMFTNFVTPGVSYSVDISDLKPVQLRQMALDDFNPADYVTRQIFYPSKDGTKIPMFVIRKAGTEQEENKPCMLYGYGGFMISLLPAFSASWVVFLKEFGGTVVIANIRGGDEYGEEWHNQGIISKKQNCFDDFQYAAQYLIDNRITSSEKLAIMGGSNGGLLVAACANQAPHLFRCVVARVGVLDVLKFHKYGVGAAWKSDYGDPDKAEDYQYIKQYSPVHNVFDPDEKKIGYPAMLITTADHDDRVSPLHSFKYAAELQHKAGKSVYQKQPLCIRIETKAGHGAGKPTSKVIEESADIFAFIYTTLDH